MRTLVKGLLTPPTFNNAGHIEALKVLRHGVGHFSQPPPPKSTADLRSQSGEIPPPPTVGGDSSTAHLVGGGGFAVNIDYEIGTSKPVVILLSIQIPKTQIDLENRALIGMIADPRPPVEVL
ncbi:hypothetical protein L7F22_057315 [Adiantum nelumboides]|nr:hypothetical protein [Adiantum nelumboides]